MAKRRAWRVFWAVMSPTMVTVPGMARMGSRSTPTILLPTGVVLAATCSHPPAPRCHGLGALLSHTSRCRHHGGYHMRRTQMPTAVPSTQIAESG